MKSTTGLKPLTQDQRAAFAMARQLGCVIYNDSARRGASGNLSGSYNRIKGFSAHAQELVRAVRAAFGTKNVRVYTTIYTDRSAAFRLNAISIRRKAQ